MIHLVGLKVLKGKKSEGLSVYLEKKSITINSESGVPALEVTNEYGNSVTYEISDSYNFDKLFANLWQFVKGSQH
jgi:hypothetical protein